MTDSLHRLALDYRTARAHAETVDAWEALEKYVNDLTTRHYEAGRAYEAGLKAGKGWLEEQKGVGQNETG